MIYGSNEVYTPVEAYSVMPMDTGVISGGFGDDATVTGGARFYWVYYPNNPNGSPSGFTGNGWFTNIEYSPIVVYCAENNKDLDTFFIEFQNDRTNLDDVFRVWNNWASAQFSINGTNYVNKFFWLAGEECAAIIQ